MNFARLMLPVITPLHRFVFRATRGRIGSHGLRSRFLILEHTGRRTGQLRRTPLLYVADGDRLVVAASNAGRDRHPAWWLNLEARPEVVVDLGAERVAVKAHRATGAEAERLWILLTDSYRFFAGYRTGTQREIPVVVFERIEP